MNQNSNQNIINRLSKRMARNNKVRNIVTIIAIILTTFMISSVFCIGFSFLKNYQVFSNRTSQTKATVTVDNCTSKQIEQIKKIKHVLRVGIQLPIGNVNLADEKYASVGYIDEIEFNKNLKPCISNIHGNYPKDLDEIMLSEEMLNQLKIEKPLKNMSITLDINTDHGIATKSFKLSGWFRNYEGYTNKGYPIVFVSKKYCEENNYSLTDNVTASVAVTSGKSASVAKEIENQGILNGNQEINNLYEDNDYSTAKIVVTVIILVIALFIIISGYLLIYNVIYISVSRDIRFYGMLKTIGTTGKQIRKLVKKQIIRLAVIGLPIGLICSIAASFAIVPYAMRLFNTGDYEDVMPGNISFHPAIYIGTILFAFITIVISCRKPAKIAGNVSAIEALRYTEGNSNKKKISKTTSGGKVYRLAIRNVFREKKRAIIVFLSLFMGCITLLSFQAFIGSLKMDGFIESNVPHNFTYSNEDFTGKNNLSDEFVNKIKSTKGIKKLEVIRGKYILMDYSEAIEPVIKEEYDRFFSKDTDYESFLNDAKSSQDFGCYVYSISDEYLKEYNKDHTDQIDIDAFNNGKIALVQIGLDQKQYHAVKGQTLKLTDPDKKITSEVQIGGSICADCVDYAELSGVRTGMPSGLYVSDQLIDKIAPDSKNVYINIDTTKTNERKVYTELKSLNAENTSANFDFETQIDTRKEFKVMTMTMQVFVTGISGMLLIIGILNFINVMLTNVYNRKMELTIMESIGMTKKQLRSMLVIEGMCYAVITSGLILTLGSGIMNLIGKYTTEIADYASYNYPVSTVVILISTLLTVCIIVPAVVYQITSKQTIADRLKN